MANVLSKNLPNYSASDEIADSRSLIRHDSAKLAQIIDYVSQIEQNKKLIKKVI